MGSTLGVAGTLLLNGCMGSGKTTVGRILAERTGARFIDLDAVVVERAGRSVAEIFATEGETGFREREALELDRCLEHAGPQVVSLGGGSLLDRARRRAALSRARVVTLAARAETLARRTEGPGRPLLERADDRLRALQTLLETRAEAYAEAHALVQTDDVPPDVVAERVAAAWTRASVLVPLGTRTYAVDFHSDNLDACASVIASLMPTKTFLVTDANVQAAWGERFVLALEQAGCPSERTVVLRPGEENKHLGSVESALRVMVEAGADRDAVVVGHGGGVVTDISGFVAATLLRGVRWVAVPTTLLAMVDASVGGKTGVDLGPSKNAVGAFHQPSGVAIDIAHLGTETRRGFVGGLAEVVKSAAIGSPELFELLTANVEAVLRRDPLIVASLVRESVAIKARIVGRDERESGERALLNFGHTVGHALESHGKYLRLSHGEAVSLGTVAAVRVGVRLGVTPPALGDQVVGLLRALGLPTDLDGEPLEEALPLVALDKKRRGNAVRFILLHALGDARVHPIETSRLPGLLGA